MSHVRMGVNGFGRIGRFVFRSTFLGNAGKA
jgi:glyceraldehyde-3-phosphate dehydrogenase/erythrose-4-phosphate dehydrogenase